MDNFSPESIINQRQEELKVSKPGLFSLKNLFIVLGIVIVIEIVFAARLLLTPSVSSPGAVLQPLTTGQITLIAPKQTYKIGEEIPVTIRLFTGGYETDGADVILKYDPNLLEASSSGIITHNLYSDYPFTAADKGGLIQVSGINTSQGFNGLGNFATITFRAKVAGKATISVEFAPGRTDESNITKSKESEDILGNVGNVNIDVTEAESTSNTALSCADISYQSCIDSAGNSGTYWCSGLTDGNNCKVGCFKDRSLKELGCKVEGL